MTPSTHPAKKIDQVDSDKNNLGQSNMIKEKVINNPQLVLKSLYLTELDTAVLQVQLLLLDAHVCRSKIAILSPASKITQLSNYPKNRNSLAYLDRKRLYKIVKLKSIVKVKNFLPKKNSKKLGIIFSILFRTI